MQDFSVCFSVVENTGACYWLVLRCTADDRSTPVPAARRSCHSASSTPTSRGLQTQHVAGVHAVLPHLSYEPHPCHSHQPRCPPNCPRDSLHSAVETPHITSSSSLWAGKRDSLERNNNCYSVHTKQDSNSACSLPQERGPQPKGTLTHVCLSERIGLNWCS